MGIIRCTVGLGVLALDANGGIAEIPHTSINSLFVWATPLLGYDLGVRTVDSNVPLQLSLPVETGYQIWVTLQFELFVGVDIRSNLYVDANFSHLRSFYQGPGLIGAPVVGLVVFC